MPISPTPLLVGHNRRISITFLLDRPPPPGQDFDTILIVARDTFSESAARTKVYKSAAAAVRDGPDGLGDIAAGLVDLVTVAFAQNNRGLQQVIIGNQVITGTPETAEEALTAIEADLAVPYFVVIPDTHATADLEAFSAACATRDVLFIGHTTDNTWETATPDAAFDNLRQRTNTSIVYDAVTDRRYAVSLAARALINPNLASDPWVGPLRGVQGAAPDYSDTADTNLKANRANYRGAFGKWDHWTFDGVLVTGAPISAYVTAQWLRYRIHYDVTDTFGDASDRHAKIPTNKDGQATVIGVIDDWFRTGANPNLGHITPGQYVIEAADLSDDDKALGNLNGFTAEATTPRGAVSVNLGMYFTTDDVVPAEGA